MKGIAIYFEGGGDTAHQKVELRNGLDRLLDAQKTAARAKGLGWKSVPSGGRQRAYDAFINGMRRGDGTPHSTSSSSIPRRHLRRNRPLRKRNPRKRRGNASAPTHESVGITWRPATVGISAMSNPSRFT